MPSLVEGLNGRVFAAGGSPVVGAEVQVFASETEGDDGLPSAEALGGDTTDENGYYRIELLVGSYNLMVLLESEGALEADVEVGRDAEGKPTKVERNLRVSPLGKVQGRVTLSDGNSPLGVNVFIPGTSFDARAAEDGSFVMSRVPRGTYNIVATLAGYETVRWTDVEIDSESPRGLQTRELVKTPLPVNVSSFSATPNSGVAPLATTFSWTLSGSETAVPCTLDTNSDGNAEYSFEDCRENISQAHTYVEVASLEATLNLDGKAKARLPINIVAPGETPKVPPAITSFTATPAILLAGETATLSWNVTSDAPLTLTLDVVGDVSGKSSAEVAPETSAIYTLTATNEVGTAQKQVSLDVQPVVDIFDEVLLQNVLEALGKGAGPVTFEEMAKLSTLTVTPRDGKPAQNLSGLENAVNLTKLQINGSDVSDLKPLEGLSKLTQLGITATGPLSNLKPLAGLTALTRLAVSGTGVSDLSPLEGLSAIRVLELNDNEIGDLSALVGNPGLNSGDTLELLNNRLDLCDGSDDRAALATLTGRGVSVRSEPQKGAESCPEETPVPEGDVRVGGFHITQSVQTLDGSVPLVAGRGGLARVFVVADRNLVQPVTANLHLSRNGQRIDTLTATNYVPTEVDQSNLWASYNFEIPASWLREGFEVEIETDPDNSVLETNEANNRFPAAGRHKLDVRSVPTLNITLVPVTYGGKTAEVTQANAMKHLGVTQQIHPLSDIDVEIRAPYVFDGGDLSTADGWKRLVYDLKALRLADGSARTYIGYVVPERSPYSGLGFVGGTPVAAVLGFGGFYADQGLTTAHELGHIWGRRHVTCNGETGVDAAYPYAGGSIGVFGYDAVSSGLKSHADHKDIMSYCKPRWTSDYTYQAVMDYRAQTQADITPQSLTRVLYISGAITERETRLEPTLELVTRPSPPTPGPYTLEGLDSAGNVLFALPFSGEELAEGDEIHFGFTVPESRTTGLALLRVLEGGRILTQTPSSLRTLSVAATPQAQRLSGGDVEVRWDASHYPTAVIRDGKTGRVLSIARGGEAVVTPQGSVVGLTLSDGLRSLTREVEF